MQPSTTDTQAMYCVIGGGPSGITAVKNLLQQNIPVQGLEREDDLGGNWYYGRPYSSVYRSTHLISSKRLTEYVDFPMPEELPEFPSHEQACEYLRSYARHFNLYQHYEFNAEVAKVEPHESAWRVTLASGEVRLYRGVIVANGHHWDPKIPEYPGEFTGEVLHSGSYKSHEVLAGKRILVVGAGNSGCDIAVEGAMHGRKTFHSMRRGYHYLPKFLRGKPIDVCGERVLNWGFPLWLRRLLTKLMVKTAIGLPQDFGLPRPDHRLFESHPIINSQMLYYVGHGKITPKPDVAEFCGSEVRFVDGTVEPIDLLVYATGFQVSFPFFEQNYISDAQGELKLYLNIFHPEHDNLFFAGLIQPDSGQWGIVDCQSQLIARYIQSWSRDPQGARRFQQLKQQSRQAVQSQISYVPSARHFLEVEHFSYRKLLEQKIKEFA